MVSIIIPCWNSEAYIVKCLSAIRKQTYNNYELFIVDNDSTDNSIKIINEEYKDLKPTVIPNPSNLGFAKAMNQGIIASKGEYVMALNMDAILTPDYIEKLVAEMAGPMIGSATGKLYRFLEDNAGERIIDSTGHILRADQSVVNRGEEEKDNGQYDDKKDIFGVCAAAALYKREMLEDIKIDNEYFDEDFFVAFEDVDLDWRAVLRGWKSRYVPNAVAFHKRYGTHWPLKLELLTNAKRNKMLLVVKNDFALNSLMNLPIVAAYTLEDVLYNHYKKYHVYLFSFMGFLLALPWALRKRKMVRATRKISFIDFRKYVIIDSNDIKMAWNMAAILFILAILSKVFSLKAVALTIFIIGFIINPAMYYLRGWPGKARSVFIWLVHNGSALFHIHKPKVSIIMPVWNRAHIVKRAIDSVFAQNFKDWELIVVDDGSSDDIQGIISSYRSNKISLYKMPHGGVSKARNMGLNLSRGGIIAYLDSDNSWHPEYLSKIFAAIGGPHSEYSAAYCICKVFNDNSGTADTNDARMIGKPFNFKDLLELNFIDINAFAHSKECLMFSGNFDERLKRLVDWDLIIKIVSRFKPLFIPEVLVNYCDRTESNSITLLEDISFPINIIRGRYKHYREPVTVEHDSIKYSFSCLSEEKYYNWVRISTPDRNTIDYTAWGLPYLLQLEPTSLCNLSCSLCPVGQKKLNRHRNMTFNEFKSIIDDMERYLMLIVLWDWGEPFMNPDLPKMIRYAHERGIKTVTSTNAHFLDNDDYLEEVLTSGLNTLIVAIDSLDEKSYKAYRQKGDLGKAVAGLENVMKLKKRSGSDTLINLRMVAMKQNESDIVRLRDLATTLNVDKFTIKTLHPYNGLISLGEDYLPVDPKKRRYKYPEGSLEPIRGNGKCANVWTTGNILSNGDVVSCCHDFNAEMALGNVFVTPFSKVWQSDTYKQFRKKIYNDKDSITRCYRCPVSFELSDSGWFVECPCE